MRLRNGRMRFRVHAAPSAGDGYLINECSEQQLRRYLLDEGVKVVQRAIDEAIANAKVRGTSLPFATGFVLDGPWLNEGRPQGPKHAFAPMTGGARCSYCGDMESAAVHVRSR